MQFRLGSSKPCLWPISMGTTIKINIFGTHPVTSANVNRKSNSQHFLSMTVSTNIIIYFITKIKTVGGRSLLTKTQTIFNYNCFYLGKTMCCAKSVDHSLNKKIFDF